MLAGLRTIPNRAELAATSGHARAIAAFFVLCACLFVGPAFGQDAPPTGSSVLLSPSAGNALVSPAGPPVNWTPPTPGLLIDSDRFVNADIAVLFPRLDSMLTAPVGLGNNGQIRNIALGSSGLNTTVSPTFEFGALRFGPGYAEVAFRYRFLVSDGSTFIPALDSTGAGTIHTRLNFQTFDLDIRNNRSLSAATVLSWEVGARLQVVFFDNQVQTISEYEQARNYFFGSGPHFGVTLTHAMPSGLMPSGVALFGHFDTGLLVGYNTNQNFVVTVRDPVNGLLAGTASQQQSQFGPSIAARLGLTWKPDALPHSVLRGGYQFEQWYNLGLVDGSRANLLAHGLFMSWELNF